MMTEFPTYIELIKFKFFPPELTRVEPFLRSTSPFLMIWQKLGRYELKLFEWRPPNNTTQQHMVTLTAPESSLSVWTESPLRPAPESNELVFVIRVITVIKKNNKLCSLIHIVLRIRNYGRRGANSERGATSIVKQFFHYTNHFYIRNVGINNSTEGMLQLLCFIIDLVNWALGNYLMS